jgi:hypothetical protein
MCQINVTDGQTDATIIPAWTQLIVTLCYNNLVSNNVFSGQNPENAILIDLAYYNSQYSFSRDEVEVTKRHIYGKDGCYNRIYGHAEVLRGQLISQESLPWFY